MADRLADIDAIRQLRSRYLRLLDTQQFDEMVELYAKDATLRFELEAPGVVFSGRDAIREMAAGALHDVISVHHGHMAEIEVTGDTAAGIWALEDILWFGPNSAAPGRKVHSFGHLHDTYVRIDGRWLIKDVVITRLKVDQTDG